MSRKIDLDNRMIKKLYIERKFSTGTIADLFEVSSRTILRRLHEMNIEIRSDKPRDEFGRIITEGKYYQPMNAENNPKWNGGKSIYRKLAFEKYGKKEECFHCGTDERIEIHHIDRNRDNNQEWNLRPVCKSCHMKIEHPDSIAKARLKRMENLEKKRREA